MKQSEQVVQVDAGPVELEGNLQIPEKARGIVLFAHGSGSSRHSSRNRYVAEQLNEAGLGTLLFDLLTSREEEVDDMTRELHFDIPMLAERVVAAVDWTARRDEAEGLKIGLFGASTGAAAALIAAAERPETIGAVVSRGGRPDLAKEALPRVKAPTLLIVGSRDVPVIGMNEDAAARMSSVATKEIAIVEGATHLFPEPGKLEEVADLAKNWFLKYL